ncbi:MAG: hypothetical protein ABSE70_01825 [Candidatus Limnocylindrales bacterium]
MELRAVGYLFLFCFPVSVYLWSGLMVAGGYVGSDAAMPWEFQLALRMRGVKRAEGFAPMTVPGLGLLLVFFNLPLPFFLVGPFGPATSVAVVAYVVVQLLWLARIRRAVRRINRQ